MKNIKSIKKLRQLFKDVAKFNNETFGFKKGNLASPRRNNETDFVPYVSMVKSVFIPDSRTMLESYQFSNDLCKTHFIIDEENNKDEIIKVHFSNDAEYSDQFGNCIVDEPESLERLHKFVFDNLDSNIETNYDDIKDIKIFDVTYEVVKRYTKTSKRFAKSYDDALDTIKKRYHDNLEKRKEQQNAHNENEDVKSFDIIPLNHPKTVKTSERVQ